MYETRCQSTWYWMLGASALGWPRGMVWGGRKEEGSGWGTHVWLWRIHFDVWQNQYNTVKFKNKIKLKKKRNHKLNCQHLLDHRKSKRVPEKHIFLFYWLCQSLWLCGSHKLWKILKEMGIPDHLTCLLRNLHAGQKATVRTGHGTTYWFQIGKGKCQGCILSSCLFN